MRTRTARWGLSAVVIAAAGMALTACGPNDPASSNAANSTQPTAGSSAGGSTTGSSDTSGSTGHGSGAGGGSTTGAACRTANLSFSSSGGMAEGEVLINLKNVGSATCSMHGFPGVDLKGRDGTVSAARSRMTAPTVKLSPGQATHFTLHYPPNNSGGSGVTFTSAVITPPNETHPHTMPLGINIPVTSNAPTITVDPVGAGK